VDRPPAGLSRGSNLYASYAELMLRTLHLDKAQRLMQEGLRLEPTHPQCLYIAALIHHLQGRSERYGKRAPAAAAGRVSAAAPVTDDSGWWR